MSLTPRERERLEALVAAYRRLPKAEPPDVVDAAVLQMARKAVRGDAPPHKTARPWPTLLATAATMTLAIGLAWNLRDADRPEAPQPVVVPSSPPAAVSVDAVTIDPAAPARDTDVRAANEALGAAAVSGSAASAETARQRVDFVGERAEAPSEPKPEAGGTPDDEAFARTPAPAEPSMTREDRAGALAAPPAPAQPAPPKPVPEIRKKAATAAEPHPQPFPSIESQSQASRPAPGADVREHERKLEDTADDFEKRRAPAEADRGARREPEPPVVFDEPLPMAEPAPPPPTPAPIATPAPVPAPAARGPATPPAPAVTTAPARIGLEGSRRAEPASREQGESRETVVTEETATEPGYAEEAVETTTILDAQTWLAEIRAALDAGRRREAIESLREFRRAYPDIELPRDLAELIE